MRGTKRRQNPAGRASGARRSGLRRLLDGVMVIALLVVALVVFGRLGAMQRLAEPGGAHAIDGDSLRLDGDEIRLVGLDAPEFTQTCKADGKPYGCGRDARNALARLLAGGGVRCSGVERDIYGRLLAVCHSGETEINAWLVRRGLAFAEGAYLAEEAMARSERLGIWRGEAERPRDYRAEHRNDRALPPQPSALSTPLDRAVDWVVAWMARLGIWPWAGG